LVSKLYLGPVFNMMFQNGEVHARNFLIGPCKDVA